MKREVFNILLHAFKGESLNLEAIAIESFSNIDYVKAALKDCLSKQFITPQGQVTASGLDALAPYKVDNAVIMAAGLSSRCLPLSKVVPKGLFRVKGEILIEREIEQLHAAGIHEIVLVTGYMAEKFDYLAEKYGVIIVENTQYRERNNTSSIYAARSYMKNTYVCCADNYFTDNIFQPYVYDSYYTCKYTEKFLDEFCLTEVEDGYIKQIHRGGEHCWYTMGAVFFSRSFSKRFLELLTAEYNNEDVKGMLIDTFHLRHIDELPSTYMGYTDDEIKEFDTLKEFADFDSDFQIFYSEMMEQNLFERYKSINRYAGVPTNWVHGRLHYNENLWGPSPKSLDVLYQTTMEDLDLYDSTEDDDLLVELGKQLNVDKKNLFLHNGSAESIKSIFSVMLNPGDNVLLPNPGWSYYSGIVGYKFGNIIHYDIIEGEEKCIHNMNDIMEKAKKYSPKIIVITSPAMPTGNAIDAHDLEMVVKSNPGSLILVDEAYHGFAPYEIDIRRWIETYDNVVFSRTFSKFYGLANLRIGYGICSESAMHALWLDLPLHRLPHISKRIAIAALHDKEYYETILHETVEVREWFRRELNKLPNILCFKTDSNFVYIRCSGYNLSRVKEYMEENGYLIRIFEGHGEQHLRITVAPREIMEDCFNKLREGLEKNRILLTTTLTLNAMKERQLECEEV